MDKFILIYDCLGCDEKIVLNEKVVSNKQFKHECPICGSDNRITIKFAQIIKEDGNG